MKVATSILVCAAGLFAGFWIDPVQAANGTWSNATSGGLWSSGSNWQNGIIADGGDNTADFGTLDITADNTVHLDSARTIGNLIFGDSTTPSHNWILDNNSNATNVLTLAVASGTPTIQVNNQTATISLVLAGTQGLAKTGTGTLTLSGADTYTGDTTINEGTLSGNSIANSGSSSAFGAGSAINFTNALEQTATLQYTGGTASTNRNVALTVGTTIFEVTTGGAALTMSGVISSSGTTGVTKQGAGTLILSGSSTYIGSNVIHAGILSGNTISNIGTNCAFGAASTGNGFTIDSGATLQYTGASASTNRLFNFDFGGGVIEISSGGTALTVSGGHVQGSGGLTKTGAGTLDFSSSNTIYTGSITVSAGTLQVDSNNALGTTAAGTSVMSGATLKLSGVNYSTAEALSLNGSGVGASGALTNSGTSTYAGAITLAGNSKISAGGGILNLTGGITKTGAVLTLGGGGTINFGTSGIMGAGANSDLVVDGVTVNENAANDYNGPTFIRNAGVLNANVANTLPTANGRTALTMDDSGSGSSQLVLTASQQAASLGGASTSSINLGFSSLTMGTTAGSTTFAGVISGTGSLTKDGASTQVLSGSNTYSGGTTVSAGTLQGNSNSLQGNISDNAAVVFDQGSTGTYAGNLSGSGSLTKQNSGALILTGANTFSGDTKLAGGTLQVGNSLALQNSTLDYNSYGGSLSFGTLTSATLGGLKGAQNLSLTNALSANVALTVGNNDATYSGVLSGGGSLTKTGTGTQTLSGLNVYAGGTSVTGGTLSLGSITALGTGTLTINGGSLNSNVANLVNANNNAQSWNGDFTFVGTNSLDLGTGAVSLGGGTRTVSVSANMFTVGGSISGSGRLAKAGAGTLLLTGTNTYNGGTTVSAGTLQGNTTSLQGDITNNAALVFDQATSGTYSGIISGTGSLKKQNSGTLTLSGANTYGGTTTVSAGNLLVNNTSGSGTGTGAVAVNGGTLGGNGTISGPITVNSSGHLSPGASAGTLFTSSSSTLNSGTVLDYDLANATTIGGGINDLLSVTGGLTLGSSLTLNINAYQGDLANGTYKLITYTGSLTGATSGWAIGSNNASTSHIYSFSAGTPGEIDLLVAGPTSIWTGAVSANWDTSGNWQSNAKPTSPFDAVFPTPIPSTGAAIALTSGEAAKTITFNDNYTLSGGDLNVATGTITVASSKTATISSTLTGNAGINKSGAGALVLSGTNTYSGGTTVSAGTLQGNATSLQGNITDNATVVFDQASAGIYAGNLSGSGSLTKQNSGTLTLSGANTYSNGTTVSAGTLTLGSTTAIGTGTLTLSGGNLNSSVANLVNANNNPQSWNADFTFTGTNSLNLGTGPVTLGGNRVVTVSANMLTVGGAISGAASLTKSGAGTLTLSGANTYSGGTTVSAGTLQGTTASLQGNIIDNASVAFNQGGTGTYSGIVSGSGNLTVSGGGTVILTGANTYSGGTTVTSATLEGNSTSLQHNITNNGTVVFDQATNGTYSNVISGSGDLTKQNVGTLTLSGANTLGGTVRVVGGTLAIPSSGSINSCAEVDINSGASFDLQASNNIANAAAINIGTSTTLGTLSLNTFSDTVGAVTLINGAITGTGSSTLSSSSIFDLQEGTVSARLGGSGDLTKNATTVSGGNNTVTLSSASTYTGSTTINSGTLILTSSASINSSSAVNIGAGTLEMQGSDQLKNTGAVSIGTSSTSGTLSMNGNSDTVGAVTLTNGLITGSATLTGTSYNVQEGAISPLLAGTGALTKNVTTVSGGTNTVAVSGANTYTGITTINSGTLSVSILADGGVASGIGQSTNAATKLVINGGTLRYIGGSSAVTNRLFTFDANGATLDASGGDTVNFTGAGSLVASGTGNRTLTLTGSNNGNLSSVIADPSSGATALTMSGTAQWTLFGANTYTGGTNLVNGTLQLASSGAIGTTGTISFTGGAIQFSASNTTDYSARFSNIAGQAYRIDTNGQNVTLATALTSIGGTLTMVRAGTLTLTGANTYSGTTTISAGTLSVGNGGTTGSIAGGIVDNAVLVFNRSNALTHSSNISGTGTVTKNNTNTLTLTGVNTYSGGTTIGAGAVLVNNTIGSGTGTGSVIVATGGTLGGTGTIQPGGSAGITVSSGGILSPGASIGTLTLDSATTTGTLLTLASGATILAELNNSLLSDRVALINGAAGDVTFNNTVINFSDLSGGTLASGAYTLITADVPNVYTGLMTGANGFITGGLSIGTGLSAYTGAHAPSLQRVGNNIVLNIGLPGDFNGDGAVDAADYVVWRKKNGPQVDYNTWRANFGRTTGSGTGSSVVSDGSAVPEPTAVGILFVVIASGLMVRGWRRSTVPGFSPARE
jgi:fibronectin-binding autotransporter adhesin